MRKVLALPANRDRMVNGMAVAADFASRSELDKELRGNLAFREPIVKVSGFKPE